MHLVDSPPLKVALVKKYWSGTIFDPACLELLFGPCGQIWIAEKLLGSFINNNSSEDSSYDHTNPAIQRMVSAVRLYDDEHHH